MKILLDNLKINSYIFEGDEIHVWLAQEKAVYFQLYQVFKIK
jgi:hypothetical protein